MQQLVEIFEEKKESVIALRRVPEQEVQKYGIVQGKQLSDRLYEVEDMVEKPRPQEAPSRMAIIGRYILQPEIFSFLEKVSSGKGGEIQLTDGISQLARQKKVYGYEFEGEHYDIGDKFGFVRATVAYALKRPELKEQTREYLQAVINKK
jgi:UTP--glucose-1-phosphate uridylyltransferase